jgi:hypothetical protein
LTFLLQDNHLLNVHHHDLDTGHVIKSDTTCIHIFATNVKQKGCYLLIDLNAGQKVLYINKDIIPFMLSQLLLQFEHSSTDITGAH